MAKRRSDERDGERTAKHRRQHLYLVFDDWSQGYSIRKLDLCDTNPSSDSGYDDADAAANPPHAVAGEAADARLPPPVFRMPAERGLPQHFASAFGTRILAMQPGERAAGLFPVFDVRARGSIWGPQLRPDPADPVYFTVGGDRLFALAAGSFSQLYPPPLEHAGGENCEWLWYQLPNPPFKRRHVTSHALHPDGRTIFVSTERRGTAATFEFDTATAAGSFEWKRHGEWALPFDGRGHFDAALDAFVGLSRDPDTLGHLCSCDAVAPETATATSSDGGGGDDDGQRAVRARKISKEKFFSEDPAERHVGARLLHIGRSKFCLVQCVSMEDGRVDDEEREEEEEDVPRPRRHLFRLTTFSLKYDKNGDLVTGTSRRVQYCKAPKASTVSLLKNPVAFWL